MPELATSNFIEETYRLHRRGDVNNNNETLDMLSVFVQTQPQLTALVKVWKTDSRWGSLSPPSCNNAGSWWPHQPLARWLLRLPIWSSRTHYHVIRYSSIDNWLEGAVPSYITNHYGLRLHTARVWHRRSEPIKNDAQQVEVHEDKLRDVLKWWNMMADREFDSSCDVSCCLLRGSIKR